MVFKKEGITTGNNSSKENGQYSRRQWYDCTKGLVKIQEQQELYGTWNKGQITEEWQLQNSPDCRTIRKSRDQNEPSLVH